MTCQVDILVLHVYVLDCHSDARVDVFQDASYAYAILVQYFTCRDFVSCTSVCVLASLNTFFACTVHTVVK